jgi:hypothetical protein
VLPHVCCVQAELATDMHAGLTAAERRQLGELQPQIEALEKELSQAKKAAGQVSLGTGNVGSIGPHQLGYLLHCMAERLSGPASSHCRKACSGRLMGCPPLLRQCIIH